MLDVIVCANFGMEKLRGLGNTGGGKVWALPLKRLVTLTTVLRYRTACDTDIIVKVSRHKILFRYVTGHRSIT